MLLAIDGPAGAGKSTVARATAHALGYTYLDSGAMYRAVALAGDRDPASLQIAFDGDRVLLDGEDVTRRDPHPGDLRPRLAPRGRPGRPRRARRQAARAARARRLGRRGPRHRHRRRARRRREGLAHGEPRRSARAAPRAARGRGPRRATSATATRDAQPDGRRRRRRRGRHDRPVDRRRGRAPRRPGAAMKVAVVGYPNVGKSSLVNRLTGSREAVVHERAGHHARPQRDPVRVERARASRSSTPAAWTSSTPTRSPGSIREQAQAALADAQAAVLVVDARAGPAPGRRGARRPPAPLARRPGRRRGEQDRLASATSRSPPSSTRSASATRSPSRPRRASAPATCSTASSSCCPTRTSAGGGGRRVRLAVIGRPNVGKSTLVNRFLGSERVIVSDVAGTTRDAIDLPARGRRPPRDPRRHRRPAPPGQGPGLGRVLHDAALAAGGRARRRRARRLRRARRRHQPGPADRRARDAGGHARPRSSSTSGTSRAMDETDLDHERARVAQQAPAAARRC